MFIQHTVSNYIKLLSNHFVPEVGDNRARGLFKATKVTSPTLVIISKVKEERYAVIGGPVKL